MSWVRDPSSTPYLENIMLLISVIREQEADVVELVDTPDLGSGAARCESSSLSVRTIQRLTDESSSIKAP